jgi:hypothetical protein
MWLGFVFCDPLQNAQVWFNPIEPLSLSPWKHQSFDGLSQIS